MTPNLKFPIRLVQYLAAQKGHGMYTVTLFVNKGPYNGAFKNHIIIIIIIIIMDT